MTGNLNWRDLLKEHLGELSDTVKVNSQEDMDRVIEELVPQLNIVQCEMSDQEIIDAMAEMGVEIAYTGTQH